MRIRKIVALGAAVMGLASAFGATATFVPIGPTTVASGTDVTFDLVVNVATLPGFDAADVVIGAPNASAMSFAFAPEWISAFLNITGPVSNVGFYPRDVFVGGNNPTSVGTSKRLGTVTLKTIGVSTGTYSVKVDNSMDRGTSKLSRGDLRDPLSGAATFIVQCAALDVECDGDLDLVDYRDLPLCLTGPGVTARASCLRFDADGDRDVDLLDVQSRMVQFTGSRE